MCYGKSATKIIIPPFFSNVNELNVFILTLKYGTIIHIIKE